MKKIPLLLIAIYFAQFSFSQNNPPTANPDSITLLSGATIIKNVITNDTDPDGNSMTIDTILYFSGKGAFVKLSATAIKYFADSLYSGKDTAWYVVCDNGSPSLCDTGIITATVNYKFYPAHQEISIANINARINSSGELFSALPVNNPFFEVPKGSGKSSIYASNIWIGAKDAAGQLHLSAQMYGQTGHDYFFGPMATDYSNSNYINSYNRVWKITSDEISAHLQNWSSPGYMVPEVILNWPAEGNILNGEANKLAPYIDFNNNGIYDPANGDYPMMKGDQMVYIIFNDDSTHSESKGTKLGFEIQAMVYEYNLPADSALFNTVFAEYKIYNRSANNYDSLYFGQFTDLDLGNYADDYIGCDSSLNLFYAYNGDADDDGLSGYGTNPPAQGIKFLNYPMNKFIMFNNDNTVTGNPDTANPTSFYNYMKGIWKDGSPLTFGGSGYASGPTIGDYMFSGDPVSGTGWTETNSGTFPGDRRGLGVAGPFTLPSGGELQFELAFPFANAYSGNNLSSVDLLKQRAQSISVPYYSISGTILNSSSTDTISSGTAYLIKYDTAESILQYVAGSAIGINGNGSYVLGSVLPGDYLIIVRPDNASYPNAIPTYYGDSAYWAYAAVFSLSSDTTGIKIAVREMPVWTGNGFCSGIIQYGLGSGKTGNGTVTPFGDPVPGVDISLEQIPGGIKAHSNTDNNGIYSFSNIPMNNTYRLLVDIPGLPMDSSYSVTITPNDSVITNLDFVVDTTGGSAGVFIGYPLSAKEIKYGDSGFRIYPNPSGGKYTVLNQGQVNANIEIYNILGEKIYYSLSTSFTYSFIDISSQPGGIFFINIIPVLGGDEPSGKKNYTMKLIKQ